MDVGLREFVVRVDIVALSAAGLRTPVVTHASAFRLPSADAEKLRFPITVRNTTLLDITIDGIDQGYLSPRFRVVANRLVASSSAPGVGLTIEDRVEHADSTELMVDRPRGLVPRRLRMTSTTPTFHRKVTVWDEGPGARAEPLGTGFLLRIAAVAPVEVLELPVAPARGDHLRLVIENEDSPPLEHITLEALIPRPVLLFSLPEGSRTAILVFGGGRAHRPRYDLLALEAKSSLPAEGESARNVLALLDPEQARLATLGPVEANPEYDASPALAFAMHSGATIDNRVFSHRRQLEIVASPEGLSRVNLEAADLALLRPDLADLRVVDSNGRQWAYLVQNHARTASVQLELSESKTHDKTSRYEVRIPDAPVTMNRIDIETPAEFFDRGYVLTANLVNGEKQEIARGRLVRRVGDPRPISIRFDATRVKSLLLEISDGDDAPLDLKTLTARFPVPDVYLAAAPGSYDLLAGNPQAQRPTYELERVRATVLAVPASTAITGPLEENPHFSKGRRLSSAANTQRLLLWGILGLAVVVLAALTFRAARQDEDTE